MKGVSAVNTTLCGGITAYLVGGTRANFLLLGYSLNDKRPDQVNQRFPQRNAFRLVQKLPPARPQPNFMRYFPKP